MPLFSRKKDKKKIDQPAVNGNGPSKPRWEDSWQRTRVDPEEVVELLHGCTAEIKSRALDVPFLLLPFRPSSDPSAAKTFVRNYFFPMGERKKLTGQSLLKELKMAEVMVLVAVMKWCWARLPGGVVTWEAYQGFKVGEKDSRYARNSFSTFIPLSLESRARVQIINDFFDLLAGLAAHAKTNGLAGHKLSRYGGWWAFEHYDTGKGFEAGYKLWNNAANATNHLFFAYLRSQTPEPGSTNGVLDLPRSLQQLVDSVEYPPPRSTLIANDTTKVVMIVDIVSPTPFALLRRAKQFEYRDDDIALQHFSEFEDPVNALTDECRRVLRAISTTNQSHVSDAETSTSLKDPSWSRFEDIGFGSAFEEISEDGVYGKSRSPTSQGLSSISQSATNDLNRPTTPSWADFLSSGFVDENGKAPGPILLHPEKSLPPISTVSRVQSSQSHRRDMEMSLRPGELASIAKIELDDAFWWVWISSLAGEEPVARKAAFGRCALIETTLLGGQWMVMEEQVKGAAPEPTPGAYVAERKGFFSFTKKGRLGRRRSNIKKSPSQETAIYDPANRMTLDQERQAKIQRAAAELARQKKNAESIASTQRRGRHDENSAAKTSSVFTLGPMIKDEASPALQWTKQYDKKAVREQYLGSDLAGKGSSDFLLVPSGSGLSVKRSTSTLSVSKDLPPTPTSHAAVPMEKPLSPLSEVTPKVDEPTQRPDIVSQESTHGSMPSNQPAQATPEYAAPVHAAPVQMAHVQSTPAQVAAVRAAAHVATQPSQTPSVTDLSYIQHKQSSESKRSIQSGKEKFATEKGRSKKLGYNAPPPVATNKGGAMKKMFGTLRRKPETNNNTLSPDSPVNEDPAVAAARRALEGKPAKPSDGPVSPPLSPNHFAKFQNAAKQPSENAPVSIEKDQAVTEPLPVEAVETYVHPPAMQEEAVSQHLVAVPDQHEQAQEVFYETSPQPIVPKVAEFEDLSQTSSQEKAAAAQEFSRFDQGPLIDQPAFAPIGTAPEEDDYEKDVPAFEPPHRPQHQSVYSAVTTQTDGTEGEPQTDLSSQMSANDRWAQIRRNAAERAARASEEHHGRSRTETRTTDDGETSGEETIEHRVARIKARVAELTGNIETSRR